MSSKQRQRLEKWLSSIIINDGVIADVGGCQNPIKDRIETKGNVTVNLLDLWEPHGGDKPDYVMDLNVQDSFLNCEYYNYVFCVEVMEYIYEPVVAVKNLGNILTKGGVLYITFPFLYPVHKPSGEDFLRYTEYGAKKILKEGGFEVVSMDYSIMGDDGCKAYLEFITSEKMRSDRDYFQTQSFLSTEFMFKAVKL